MGPTLVALHAHPDDEAIFTGGLLLRAHRAGWRTVVVLATNGAAGANPGWAIADTAAHRRAEAEAACVGLGVDRLVVLPFTDSTLGCLPPEVIVEHLEDALEGESPTVLVTYDERGIYGHPDHVAVHCVGVRVASNGLPVYEATLSRRHLGEVRDGLVGRRALAPWRWPLDLNGRLGTAIAAEPDLLHLELGADELTAKVTAIAAHGSQVAYAPEFMGIPPGAFHRLLEHEWYGRRGDAHADFEHLLRSAS